MGLPLNLAMTPSEISVCAQFPPNLAWMACHFSPWGEGLSCLPDALPPNSMLIVNDRFPCSGHSPQLVAQQLSETVEKLSCESVLLDFQRPPEPESEAMVSEILHTLPCPVAVAEEFAAGRNCPIFLPPVPLHMDMQAYFDPWRDREIWLEASLTQCCITVTHSGTTITPQLPWANLAGGWYDPTLMCQCITEIAPSQITFTLYDTHETLLQKLSVAQAMGVHRAVGLYQQLVT